MEQLVMEQHPSSSENVSWQRALGKGTVTQVRRCANGWKCLLKLCPSKGQGPKPRVPQLEQHLPPAAVLEGAPAMDVLANCV